MDNNFVITAQIFSINPDEDMAKLTELFVDRSLITVEAIEPSWEDVWDGYEQ